MARKAHIISQCEKMTAVKCPMCKKGIQIWHEQYEYGVNDDFGRADLQEQNYSAVVCMNSEGKGGFKSSVAKRYCGFSGDLNVKTLQWTRIDR